MTLVKKQKKLIELLIQGMRLSDACLELGVTEGRVSDWMASPDYAKSVTAAVQFRLVAARIEVASNAMTAAFQILELCKNEKLDVGRKACIDILSGTFLEKEPSITLLTDQKFRKAYMKTSEADTSGPSQVASS